MRPRLAILTLVCATLAFPQIAAVRAPRPQNLEYEVKAAFLLNFTKFIDWPTAASPPASTTSFNICIAGEDPFGVILDQTVRGETVNGRPLEVLRLGHSSPKNCQILYISRTEPGTKELLGSLGPGVLTVGENDTFIRTGGMIAFILDNRRVRFSINIGATRSAMLTLSSRLLSVAKSVETK